MKATIDYILTLEIINNKKTHKDADDKKHDKCSQKLSFVKSRNSIFIKSKADKSSRANSVIASTTRDTCRGASSNNVKTKE